MGLARPTGWSSGAFVARSFKRKVLRVGPADARPTLEDGFSDSAVPAGDDSGHWDHSNLKLERDVTLGFPVMREIPENPLWSERACVRQPTGEMAGMMYLNAISRCG